MSTQRKTINDVHDIAIAFITDAQSIMDIQYLFFGNAYRVTRYGLADFPYTMEICGTGRDGGMLTLYRGTCMGTHNNRIIFKVFLKHKGKNSRSQKNVAYFRSILSQACRRTQNNLPVANNTEILKNMLEKLLEKCK